METPCSRERSCALALVLAALFPGLMLQLMRSGGHRNDLSVWISIRVGKSSFKIVSDLGQHLNLPSERKASSCAL